MNGMSDPNLFSTTQNRGFFSKLLRNFSSYGMQYDDMVVKNSVATNINEDPTAVNDPAAGMYDFFSRRATAQMSERQAIAFYTRDVADKQRILREYSIKDEIRDFLDQVADAAIIYKEKDKRFCSVADLGIDFDAEATLQPKVLETFNKLYTLFNFDDGTTAWRYFRDFLVDGFLCFEIVYDNWQKNVVGFNQIDVSSIVPAIDEQTRTKVWVQYPNNPTYRKVLLDSQIIYLSYASSTNKGDMSYLEPLIRPYNQLKLIEHTKLQFNLQQAMMHKQITVPTKGMPTAKAQQAIGQLISDYHDEVSWDDVMGTVTIDGRQHIPYSKEYWFPEGEHGTPKVEIIDQGGYNLNEDTMLTWFYNTLKRASKLPFNRFDRDNGGGSVYQAAGDVTHEEERFNLFINRMRAVFREILLKPLYIQMLLEYPELKKNMTFRSRLSIDYYGNDKYEAWANLNNLQKRAEVLGALNSNHMRDADTPWLHPRMAAKHIMEYTPEFIDENERYFVVDPDEKSGKGEGGGADMGGGGDMGGGDMGGGEDLGEEMASGDLDTGGDSLEDIGSDTAQPGGAGAQPAQEAGA